MKVYAEFDTEYGHRVTITPSSNACYAGTWIHLKKDAGSPTELPECDVSLNLTPSQLRILVAALQSRLEDITNDH